MPSPVSELLLPAAPTTPTCPPPAPTDTCPAYGLEGTRHQADTPPRAPHPPFPSQADTPPRAPHPPFPSRNHKSKMCIVRQTLLKRDLIEKIYKAFKSLISSEHRSLTGGVGALLFRVQG